MYCSLQLVRFPSGTSRSNNQQSVHDSKVQVLDLSGCRELTDAGIQNITHLTTLHQLHVHGKRAVNSGVA
jgi:hypothetical protein